MIGNGATTLTPENSEAPRENRAGLGLLERYDQLRKMNEARVAWLDEGATLSQEQVDYLLKDNPLYQRAKVSSPELASLAAKYLDRTDQEMWALFTGDRSIRYEVDDEPVPAYADVRRLAASVLAQAEGTPRK